VSDFVWSVPGNAATPTPWAAVRGAIRQWIISGSGLSGDHVIWTGQQHRIPDSMYIALRLAEIDPLGHDVISVDGSTTLIEHAIGHREAQLTITCYSAIDETDSTRAVLVLDAVRSAARLSAVADVLQAANVGINVLTPARAIGAGVTSTKFDSRAELVVLLNLVSEATAAGTAIQTVGPIVPTIL
jgi:hypothetical protein